MHARHDDRPGRSAMGDRGLQAATTPTLEALSALRIGRRPCISRHMAANRNVAWLQTSHSRRSDTSSAYNVINQSISALALASTLATKASSRPVRTNQKAPTLSPIAQ